jgi:hypothetical protein
MKNNSYISMLVLEVQKILFQILWIPWYLAKRWVDFQNELWCLYANIDDCCSKVGRLTQDVMQYGYWEVLNVLVKESL